MEMGSLFRTRCVPMFLPTALLLAGAAHGQTEATWSPLTDGAAAATHYGGFVAGGGDVDGDAVPDFAAGAFGANTEDGLLYVYSGATGSLLYGGPLAPAVPAGISGGHYRFGCGIDMSHDFNGDGRADIVVGADQDSGVTNARGFVELIDGASGTPITSWLGNAGDRFGSSVAVGDVDGDGIPDVVVGAIQGPGGPGYCAAFSGAPPFAPIFQHASPSPVNFTGYGRSVACADVDGDGFADVIVGADEAGDKTPVGSGFVDVLLGPGGSQAPYGVLSGAAPGDHFGVSVANAHDTAFDGDAFDDILVGAPQDDSGNKVGYAKVYDGLTGAELTHFEGEQTNDYFGSSVAGGIDFNADGFVDFVVGAHQNQTVGDRGFVRVQSGKPGLGPPFLFRHSGDKAGQANAGSGLGLGRSVAVIGQLDPAQTPSFVVGAWIHAGAGHIEVLTGRRLMLSVVPDTVSIGEIVSLVTVQFPQFTPTYLLAGLPPAPTQLYLGQNVPVLPLALLPGAMDYNEAWLLSAVAPASLGGLVVLVQAASKPPGGSLLLTDIQTITF